MSETSSEASSQISAGSRDQDENTGLCLNEAYGWRGSREALGQPGRLRLLRRIEALRIMMIALVSVRMAKVRAQANSLRIQANFRAR